jgi:[acyl-carrier-protein] S-malonyltransferase
MSAPIVFLCSGQGGQHGGMFDLTADRPEAAPVFAAAAAVLGQDPRALVRRAGAAMFEGPAAQILCCTQALAAWMILGAAVPRAVLAGYSVGELASWGCAGIFDVATTLRLALRRAELMAAAAPPKHGLVAIVGLTRAVLAPILSRHGAMIAITNAEDSFVVGASTASMKTLGDAVKARGATRVVALPVAVPAHTPLLQDAVSPFLAALREARPVAPRRGIRLLCGIDASAVHDVQTAVASLAQQIAAEIDWAGCLEACRASGAQLVLELGPGTALSHMAAPLFVGGYARATEDFRSIEGIHTWLARSGG